MGERFVVVGASLAGLRAVQAARRAGYTGPLTLVGGEPHPPYDRPPLSKEYLRADRPPNPTYHTPAELCPELDLDLRLGTWATGLDPDRRVIELRDDAGRTTELDYTPVATTTRV